MTALSRLEGTGEGATIGTDFALSSCMKLYVSAGVSEGALAEDMDPRYRCEKDVMEARESHLPAGAEGRPFKGKPFEDDTDKFPRWDLGLVKGSSFGAISSVSVLESVLLSLCIGISPDPLPE